MMPRPFVRRYVHSATVQMSVWCTLVRLNFACIDAVSQVGRAGGEIVCEVYQGQTHGFMLGDGDGGTLELDGGPSNPARRATLSLARFLLQSTGQDAQAVADPWASDDPSNAKL